MKLDFPAQNKVARDAQNDEERAENDKVEIEVGVLDVKQSQDVAGAAQHAGAIGGRGRAVEGTPVEPVDGLQRPLEGVSREEQSVCSIFSQSCVHIKQR